MKHLKFVAISLLAFTFFITACEDKDVTVDGLTYKINGNNNILKVDSTVASTMDNAIVGYANGGRAVFTIYLSSLSAGTYTIIADSKSVKLKKTVSAAPSTYFNLYYNPSSSIYFWGTSGTLTINENKNNKISGSFSITDGNEESESNEPISTLKGSFNNIPIVNRYISPR